MNFKSYLGTMVERDASDLYLSSGAPASAKINGVLTPLEEQPLTSEQIRDVAWSVMSAEQIEEFGHRPEMNLAITEPGVGRFRVNIFRQRNSVSLVIRNIKTSIPDWQLLGLPEVLTQVIMAKRGLVLFIGATGSGKSTSLASLIDYRNSNSAGHIITIEDPIEFVHPHKRSIVNQREVGVDTECYEDALKNTLRQAPDVILIGEIRDRETMEHALAFAETGHLAISTLHANNADQALDRIVNFFPEDRRNQLLLDLSLNLRAFVSQRLIKTVDGKRTAAVEILLGTPLVQDMIRRGDVHEIKEIMEKSEPAGMQTFDAALFRLVESGRISVDEAMKNADSPNNLRLRLNLNSETSEQGRPVAGLSLIDHEADGAGLNEFDTALRKLVESGKMTAGQAIAEADDPDRLRQQLATPDDGARNTPAQGA
ncbi:MAG: PilT/PilU family type 4a pilus ATPase [Gammaproteobacteria bacterium]|jgi:twitching motility protein PilU